MKRKCLRNSCQIEFEPNKPKQVFCSAKCRVYYSRENKSTVKNKNVNGEKDKVIIDATKPTNIVKPQETPKSNYKIDTRKPFMSDAIKKKLGY